MGEGAKCLDFAVFSNFEFNSHFPIHIPKIGEINDLRNYIQMP